MDWGLLANLKGLPPPPQPSFIAQSNIKNKINPNILLIIIVLAVVFFLSGLLHLLARCLLRPTGGNPEDPGSATAQQGQLQQLFHLHDAGVDQPFIDALPLFPYKAIIGVKDPFDCAVCLCEFEPDDKLRLLPKCSHAFHLDCIDTWLLSHSTCPLCRRSLLPADSSPGCSPMLLESGSESPCEAAGSEREEDCTCTPTVRDNSPKTLENGAKEDDCDCTVVAIKLGKFKNLDANTGGGEGTSSGNGNLDERRCFSMGSFEYVMDETSRLHVPIRPTEKNIRVAKPEHRLAMSECDCNSGRHGFQGLDRLKSLEEGCSGSASISSHKESFSVSKIWLRSKKERRVTEDSSRKSVSFRLPLCHGTSGDLKVNDGSSRRTAAELDVAGWMKNGSEFGSDVEVGSCHNSIGSHTEEVPSASFGRRTLLWISGRQTRVVDHD